MRIICQVTAHAGRTYIPPCLSAWGYIRSNSGPKLLWECFVMLFTYEILREAGIRMPKMIGPAVSIVGALVLGQSAVEAGLVSTLW
ncbi:spore germination protein [Sporomusa silvacetica]|nr:spore germination protein [Sporomusa silvacetica]